MLPNFLVIGVEKSATTWLYYMLKEHPDIFMPETKEIHFFNKYNSNLKEINNYEKLGINWYKKFFKKYNGEKAIGEVTPMYLCDPYAPARIKSTINNIKLIAILRNPVDRAYSHYWMAKSKNHTNLTFEEVVIQKTDKFIKRGLYYEQLERYYKYFDKENILVILMDDMLNRSQEILSKIYRFLEVKPDYVPSNINTSKNRAGFYRSPMLLNVISDFTKFFRRKTKMGFIIDFFKNIGVADFIKRINKKEFNYPEMPKELRKNMFEYYKESNKKLSKLLDRNLSTWNR